MYHLRNKNKLELFNEKGLEITQFWGYEMINGLKISLDLCDEHKPLGGIGALDLARQLEAHGWLKLKYDPRPRKYAFPNYRHPLEGTPEGWVYVLTEKGKNEIIFKNIPKDIHITELTEYENRNKYRTLRTLRILMRRGLRKFHSKRGSSQR